jgi:outer membrane protein assembly factor BamB
VGDYRLLGRLGEGGMSIVYRGCSPGGRTVAVKIMREQFAHSSYHRDRFYREVAAVGKVTGAFTAPLLESHVQDERPWLVTDHLPGLSLRAAVETFGALPSPTVRLLAAALAEALADIHRAGLVHRDLKPENIILTVGGPRVIDFGIARLDDAAAITIPGTRPGTASFMSPEQASGGRIGASSDIFALGAVLVFAATGRGPFDAGDDAATLSRVCVGRADLSGLTDRRLREFVADCLRSEPERRPSATALLDWLGEPAASVRGTGWLPAPVAEAIDRCMAGAGPPAPDVTSVSAVAHDALPDEATVDPAAVSTGSPDGLWTTDVSPPNRREFLVAAGKAVPVGVVAAVVLRGSVWSADSRPTPLPPPRSATAPPPRPEATMRWRRKVLTIRNDSGYPDLYSTGGVVLAAHAGSRDVRAVDPRTGRILWSRVAEEGPVDEVTVGDDVVFLAEDQQDSSVFRAVDPTTGRTRWTHRLPLDFAWGAAGAGSVICLAVGEVVTALDAKDGHVRWSARATGMSITARAGLVVTAGDSVLAGLDAASGRKKWTYEVKPAPLSALIGEGLVFTRDTYGTVYAVHADDGTAAWKKPIDYRSSVQEVGNGMVYVDEADGHVRALRADTGEPVWSRRLGQGEEKPYGESYTLGLSAGTLWVGSTDQTVYALDAVDGRVLWTYGADAMHVSKADPGAGALALAGLVLLSTSDGHIEAINPPV